MQQFLSGNPTHAVYAFISVINRTTFCFNFSCETCNTRTYLTRFLTLLQCRGKHADRLLAVKILMMHTCSCGMKRMQKTSVIKSSLVIMYNWPRLVLYLGLLPADAASTQYYQVYRFTYMYNVQRCTHCIHVHVYTMVSFVGVF